MRVDFIWNDVYKGVQLAAERNNPSRWWFWIGWTNPYFKRLGW